MRNVFFWLTIIFVLLFIIPLSVGQHIPIEFTDNNVKRNYYFSVVTILAFVFLIFLYIKMQAKDRKKNSAKIGIIALLVGIIYIPIVTFVFIFIGFGCWQNENILYRNKENKNISINEQIYDIGAFGYGKRRTVEVRPLLPYLHIIHQVDEKKVNRNEWDLVNEEGDLKYP